ncbi:MAG: XrtA system polysaccharide deacetylase [Gemmatimonadota bacterium]
MRAPAMVSAFTVDVEDWYQGLEIEPGGWDRFESRLHVGLDRLLGLLAESRTRATFFVLGAAAERHPEMVRLIEARGHEIGTHGYGHGFVYRLGRDGFRDDLKRSLDVIGPLVSEPIRGHRAPFFSITRQAPWAFEVLAEAGIAYDSSVFPVRNYRYGIPDAPRWIYRTEAGVLEFPPSTLRLAGRNLPIAGGAYFRLFPYTLSLFALRRIAASGHPAAFYIHPWELDPEHPRLHLPRRISVPHYHRLGATAARLRRLLGDLRFGGMGDVLSRFSEGAEVSSPEGAKAIGSRQS